MLGTRLLELTAVVSRLHRVCPWTKTQSASDMIAHTRNELAEVEEAMAACASGSGEEAAAPSRAHLEAELGDVLFDVLMLIEAASKEYGTAGLEEVCEHSIRKLRRRAPYAFEGGPAVVTTADAEVLWQAGKAAELASKAAPTVVASEPVGTPPDLPADATVSAAAAAVSALALANELRSEAEKEGLAEWQSEIEKDFDASSSDGEGWRDTESESGLDGG